MNKVILHGHLTRDPEIRYTVGEEPTAIAKFCVAVGRRYKRKGEAVPATDFINCTAFGKSAEIAEKHLRCGKEVCVSGSIRTGSYTNREEKKVYYTEVEVTEIDFCGKKGDSNEADRNENANRA